MSARSVAWPVRRPALHLSSPLRAAVRLHPTIRVRLMLWYALVLTIILILAAGSLYLSLKQSLYTQLDDNLEAQAAIVTKAVRIQNGTTPQLGNYADRLAAGTVVTLYGPSGHSLVQLSGSQTQPNLLPPVMEASVQTGQPQLITTTYEGQHWRLYARAIMHDQQTVGVVEVGQSQEDIERTLDRLLFLMAIGLPVGIILASIGGYFLAARALDPVDRLTRAALEIEAKDLSRRVEQPTSNDEVGRLARTFNDMLSRLEQAFKREHRFTGDAAHELRSPLAVMKNQVEVALSRPRSAADYARTLAEIDGEVDRMSRLVGELLTLARADDNADTTLVEPVDLADVARQVVEQFEPLAAERGIRLRADATAPVVVAGDLTRLTQLAINLVDNGLSYTPPGGRVDVRASRAVGQATLAVADTGPGIAPEHLPHIFERFYRADRARSRADGHFGLGLAVCAWIAERHHGQLSVESQLGRGTTFTLRLPVSNHTNAG